MKIAPLDDTDREKLYSRRITLHGSLVDRIYRPESEIISVSPVRRLETVNV